MSEKQLRHSLKELPLLALVCGGCKTEITVDVSADCEKVPQFCPRCNRNIGAFGELTSLYKNFYIAALKASKSLRDGTDAKDFDPVSLKTIPVQDSHDL